MPPEYLSLPLELRDRDDEVRTPGRFSFVGDTCILGEVAAAGAGGLATAEDTKDSLCVATDRILNPEDKVAQPNNFVMWRDS